jgi:DNA-directed RNA polymerase I, II, and III subunit RPABC2
MDQLRFDSRVLHAEVQPISRENIDTTTRITLPYYSKYEFTTLMGMRAQQLSDGAKPMVSLAGLQPSHPQFVWKLAQKEIEERALPFIVHRKLPDGVSEYWSTTELSIIW